MKITAQLSGVNRPLSVELRLIHFCSCHFDSQEEHDTSSSRGVLTKRSDFRSAQGLVRYSPFGGVEFGKKPGRYRRFAKRNGTTEQNRRSSRYAGISIFRIWVGTKRSEGRYSWTSPRRLATVIA